MDWTKLADTLDELRVIPRIIMAGYGVLVWHVVSWSLAETTITTQHASIIASIIGIASFLVPAYFNSGRKNN